MAKTPRTPPRARGLGMRTLEQAAETLRTLGHPLRLKLIEHLLHGPAPVGELANRLKQPHALTSHHLNQMRLHGILARTRDGRQMVYRIRDAHAASILEWIHRRSYDPHLVQDGEAI